MALTSTSRANSIRAHQESNFGKANYKYFPYTQRSSLYNYSTLVSLASKGYCYYMHYAWRSVRWKKSRRNSFRKYPALVYTPGMISTQHSRVYLVRYELLPSDDERAKLILSSKLVEPSWHVFVGLLVIKFSMLIRRTAARRRRRRYMRQRVTYYPQPPSTLPQNTKIIEFKLP